MKTILKSVIILLLFVFATHSESIAQKGGVKKGHPHHKNHPKKHHRGKVVVYKPMWGPSAGYGRRWVYFPRYNSYFDNRRNMWVHLSGPKWIATSAVPPIMVNVNLSNEKKYELDEDADENENAENSNKDHVEKYKPE